MVARATCLCRVDRVSNLQIIVGSTRPTRASDHVTPWVVKRATAHGAFAVELLDLRDWPLPMFQEHVGTIGDMANPTFSEPIVREWNAKLGEGDAYLTVMPEYNHSVSGVLKNALDSVFITHATRNKPITSVSYSGGQGSGIRAIEHLAQIAVELEMAPLRATVPIANVASAFDDDHEPNDPMLDIALQVALDDLAWWSGALEKARADNELVPSKFRVMAERRRLAEG
ncbi:MAG: hypothetical protein QOE63_1207 [Acidimicrobiaceae bacterium]|jgi:NAD(P)H-dependent FMN reductase